MIEDIPKLEKMRNLNLNVFELDDIRTCPSLFWRLQYTEKVPKDEDGEKTFVDSSLWRNHFISSKKYYSYIGFSHGECLCRNSSSTYSNDNELEKPKKNFA